MDLLVFPANRRLLRPHKSLAIAHNVLVARLDELQLRNEKRSIVELIEAIYMIHDMCNISLNGDG
jgi:hypothetical protein